jgi:hypothetical protein
MLSYFLGSSSEAIQVSNNNAREVMENVSHGPLESHTSIFESKRHDVIRKSTPWGSECSLILVCGMDLYLIIAREPIHGGQGRMANIVIDDLVNERCWEVVFGTSVIEIMKVNADTNGALFFVNRDKVGGP